MIIFFFKNYIGLLIWIEQIMLLFVCLFNRSLRAETHLGPDGPRLEQNAQARL